jgi:hypothetical protein
MLRKMQIIISSLLLILALHFLLQGINYRKNIYLSPTIQVSNKETFEFIPESTQQLKMELLNAIQCEEPSVIAANTYTDNTNDANFQSNVLNTNRFYVKNGDDTPKLFNSKDKNSEVVDPSEINSFSDVNKYSNQLDAWKYKNELVMNGGELLNGITGYDNMTDDYFSYNNFSVKSVGCNPSNRGATQDDDLRMGMGSINREIRDTN